MTTTDSIPVAPLSIWDPVHLGTDELGRRVEVTLAERNMLIGGEPGGGKSVALQLIVAHGALSADCRLILVDGKRVELGLWQRLRGPVHRSLGQRRDRHPQVAARPDRRADRLAAGSQAAQDHPGAGLAGVPDAGGRGRLLLGHRRHPAQQKEFNALNRDIVARGRAPGSSRSRPPSGLSADIIPTSLRDLFGYRWAFRCSTEASSDTILGHGWANQGFSATEIDPQARGVGWLSAEDGIPRRIKAAYLTDQQIIDLAAWAAQARAIHHANAAPATGGNVVELRREGAA